MKTRLVFSLLLLLLLAACGDFQWFPDPAKPDATPDQFSFTTKCALAVDQAVESDAITVSGINQQVAISVTGGEYSVNGGTFGSTAGTVSNGQTVKVRPTGGKITIANTTTTVTLTIGGVSGNFAVSTAPCGQGSN